MIQSSSVILVVLLITTIFLVMIMFQILIEPHKFTSVRVFSLISVVVALYCIFMAAYSIITERLASAIVILV